MMDLTGAKILTVRQPWAWAIAHGGKTTENRSQPTRHRGPVLIHAGKGWSNRGGVDPRVVAAAKDAGIGTGVFRELSRYDFRFGEVLAVAELVDCHTARATSVEACCAPWGESFYRESGGRTVTGVVHLTLDKIRPLPNPVPCRGRLGLTTPPADVVAAVAEQLA